MLTKELMMREIDRSMAMENMFFSFGFWMKGGRGGGEWDGIKKKKKGVAGRLSPFF